MRLIGDLGPTAARDRAQRRIEAWLASEAGRALRDLRRLKQAVENGTLKGLPRGLAFRLIEAGGVIDGEIVIGPASGSGSSAAEPPRSAPTITQD